MYADTDLSIHFVDRDISASKLGELASAIGMSKGAKEGDIYMDCVTAIGILSAERVLLNGDLPNDKIDGGEDIDLEHLIGDAIETDGK